MHSPSRQPLLTSPVSLFPFQIGTFLSERQIAILVGLLGFFCFMPYPALNFGNQSAIQIGNALTLLMCLPLLFISWRGRPFHIYVFLVAPMLLSMLNVGVTGNGNLDLCMKSIVIRSMAGITLLATQYYAPRFALELLTGIAVATVIHVAVGAWQLYCFSSGQFPLAEIYVNNSFLSVQEMARTIALYIQRPFGIFPEPSAMSSSLAPFVLFWTARACGLVHLKRTPSRFQEVLFATAAAGGLLLIILSRSGHTLVTLFPMSLFAILWFVRCRATLKNYAVIVVASCVVLPLLIWLGANAMSDRLGGKSDVGNSSWGDRSASLRVGFLLVTTGGADRLIFGIGPGLCAPIVYDISRLEAVWSVLLNYMYETGLIGSAVIAWLAQYLLRIWRSQRFNLPFISIAFVWFVGVLLTTSYDQLLPIWVALGWLTVWPAICQLQPVENESNREAVQAAPSPDPDRLAAERGKGVIAWEPSEGRDTQSVLADSGRPLQSRRWRDA